MEPLFIVWQEKFETGIPILDDQYRGLISLINAFYFHRGDATGDINKFLVPTAEMFKIYIRIYCATVERLMQDTGYPDLQQQHDRHEEMINHIHVMDAKYRRHLDATGMLQFLKEYFFTTIEHQENEYLPYLRQRLGVE